MANFFSKTKPSAKSSSSVGTDGASGSAVPGPSQSEFEKTFKPFALKKDAELAPTNWFQSRRRRAKGQAVDDDVIILDDIKDDEEDIVMECVELTDVSQMTEEGR